MNTSHGWIKLYRCLLDDAVGQKSAYLHLWVVLLLTAAHKEHEFIFNNQIHTLYPGQLITGRKRLSKLTGIPGTTIARILKCFENGQRIRVKTTTKYSIITIIHWEKYQSEAFNLSASGQQMDNKRTASGQPADTYKKDKNEKNEKTHRANDSLSSEQKDIHRIREANERAAVKWLAEEDKKNRGQSIDWLHPAGIVW